MKEQLDKLTKAVGQMNGGAVANKGAPQASMNRETASIKRAEKAEAALMAANHQIVTLRQRLAQADIQCLEEAAKGQEEGGKPSGR